MIEIASPWTMKKELNEKLRLYERHGVREYWFVDGGNRALYRFRIPLDELFAE